jgi:hypothetical protein
MGGTRLVRMQTALMHMRMLGAEMVVAMVRLFVVVFVNVAATI